MARHQLTRDHRIYEFSPDLEPALTVEQGDTVTFDTINSVEDAVTTEADVVESVPAEVNGATGPVAVEGAEPGDVLKVTIEDVAVTEDIGRVLVMPEFGLQQDEAWIDSPRTRITDIDEETVNFGSLSVPLQPVIGTIGVAPKSETYSTLVPHDHGGNLDTTAVAAGATLYLPVFQPGGLLAMGDSKAVMADGEMCGTGAEVGTEIEATITVLSGTDVPISRPIVATEESWKTIASAETMERACRLANEDLVRLLSERHDMDPTDAYMFSSLVGGLEVSQVVDPLVTARNSIPRRYLDGTF